MFKTSADNKTRLAIVNPDKCKPKKCNQECKKVCPVVRIGKECINVTPTSKCASIVESSCIGCGMCVSKCPFDAIQIINLPNELTAPVLFRYGPNQFQLHRLPQPRRNQILGIIGVNGIGKSTIVKILSNKAYPNWGARDPPDPMEIISQFRGSDLQNYFKALYEGDLKVTTKPQMVESLASVSSIKSKTVQDLIQDPTIRKTYRLDHLSDRPMSVLSGGELQRVAIARVCQFQSNVYIFDEFTNFLDVRQRILMSSEIRKLSDGQSSPYVLVVDHDIAMLDYISDYVCCLYGKPAAYGVVSMPSTVREGINSYLNGFLPSENMRIREDVLKFVRPVTEEEEQEFAIKHQSHFDYEYPDMAVTLGKFHLDIQKGGWNQRDIVLMVGENGVGKTTMVRSMAGIIKMDGVPDLNISFKPQKIVSKFEGTVRELFHAKIQSAISHSLFRSDVMDPLKLKDLMDLELRHLSGGEMQRVAIALALGKPADVYLLDEPLGFLDVEMRLAAATAIRRFVKHSGKSAFVVEHDIVMGVYLADKVVTFSGNPGLNCMAHSPTFKEEGMNRFMQQLDVTIRQDIDTLRPRINKSHSQLDQEQKKSGQYYMQTQSHIREDKGVSDKKMKSEVSDKDEIR